MAWTARIPLCWGVLQKIVKTKKIGAGEYFKNYWVLSFYQLVVPVRQVVELVELRDGLRRGIELLEDRLSGESRVHGWPSRFDGSGWNGFSRRSLSLRKTRSQYCKIQNCIFRKRTCIVFLFWRARVDASIKSENQRKYKLTHQQWYKVKFKRKQPSTTVSFVETRF